MATIRGAPATSIMGKDTPTMVGVAGGVANKMSGGVGSKTMDFMETGGMDKGVVVKGVAVKGGPVKGVAVKGVATMATRMVATGIIPTLIKVCTWGPSFNY